MIKIFSQHAMKPLCCPVPLPSPTLSPLVRRYACGELTRAGTRCGQRAGRGTTHVGLGPCCDHGGRTWQPSPVSSPADALAIVHATFDEAAARLAVPEKLPPCTMAELMTAADTTRPASRRRLRRRQ